MRSRTLQARPTCIIPHCVTLQVVPPATVLALALVVPHVLVNRFSSFLSPIPVVRPASRVAMHWWLGRRPSKFNGY